MEAAQLQDRSAVRPLIEMLDSDDVAARMVAIRSLERITGETLGYDYAGAEPQRRAAIARWVAWESGGAASASRTDRTPAEEPTR